MDFMRKWVYLIFIVLTAFYSCKPDDPVNGKKQGYKNGISIKIKSTKGTNTGSRNTYNQTALYLAGKKTDRLKKIQKKKYYLDYVKLISESWKKTTTKNLKEIRNWTNSYFNEGANDSICLFYPFSGPDFLYANVFFPNAKTYLLVGLENPGKLPNIEKMSDGNRAAYLQKLLHSLRYIDKAGYFTTKQMMSDFTDASLNGIIHLLLFYIAKTNHNIVDITTVEVDDFGQTKEKKNFQVENEKPNGLKIEFSKNGNDKIKTLYYFPVDLSDENLKDNLGFLLFLSNFGKKNTFMKSASYILHSEEFRIVRELILKQSKTILQDDSGIPYSVLKNAGFYVNLYGNYSRTINTFSNYYQADLHKALESRELKQLPFKLGYNSWENEMVLLLAQKSGRIINQPVTYKRNKETVIYKVQFKSSWKKIPKNSEKFKGMPPVSYYFNNNLYKYTIGNCASQQECEAFMKTAVENGFIDAFIVAFYQKNRISLDEAEKLEKR